MIIKPTVITIALLLLLIGSCQVLKQDYENVMEQLEAE